jgi:LysR family transcriptional regulator, low CO2-responsive transcriptional regulator
MNYTLHQLQVFLEVVRQRSITKAAEEMHMTQPALSIQLKNFQMQFDIPLIEKAGRTLVITDFGMSIAEIAENIIREADTLKYKTKEYGELLSGKLRISSASTGKYIIPYFLNGFLEKNSGIDLVLYVTNKINVYNSLKNNEIDFALITVESDEIPIEEEHLIENRIYMVGNSPEFYEKRPFIFREYGSATRKAMDLYLDRTKGRKRIELTSNEAVKQAVIAGLGYSLIPLIGIKNELLNKEIYILPADNLPIKSNWRLVWLKNKKLSPVAKAYLNYIQANKQHIINTHFQWYLDFNEKVFSK